MRDLSGWRSLSVRSRPAERETLDRRRLIALLAVATAGLAAPGCIPLDRLLSRYRSMLGDDPELETSIYRGLVDAVVPGLDAGTLDSPNLTRVFFDEDLPFAPYHLDLSAHLCKSARRHFDDWRFDELNPAERRQVVRLGLNGGRLVGRLYAAGVFITQVATYAGIYDDDRGCAMIEYPGRNQLLNWGRMCYQDLRVSYTSDGVAPGGQPA